MNDPKNVSLPQKAVSVPLRGKGQPKANGCHAKTDSARFAIASELVASGKPIPQAMREAGYSKHTAKQSNQYPVKKALIKVRDSYLMSYIRDIKKEKMDGKSTLHRLAKIVHGKDDYNANQAIKTHVMILLKNAPNSDHSNGFLGVFVVPASQNPQDWQNHASALQNVNVPSMIQDAEVIEK